MAKSTNGNNPPENHENLEIITGSANSNFGCSTISSCEKSGIDIYTKTTQMHRSVTIDGQLIEVTPFDNNIVDLASRVKIKIPAPCYRTKRSKGCCSACVVEIDGEQKFACSTIPENGMNIVVDRADLKAIRKQRLLEYKQGVKSGNPCECSVSGSSNSCC